MSDLKRENKQHKDSRQIDLTRRVEIIKTAVDKMAESKTILESAFEEFKQLVRIRIRNKLFEGFLNN